MESLKKPRTRGRPAHAPTAATRKSVKSMTGLGATQADIAQRLGVSVDTLKKHYGVELNIGEIDANMAVAGALFKKALGGNVVAQIFWLKTRAKWRESHASDAPPGSGDSIPDQPEYKIPLEPDEPIPDKPIL